MVHLRTSLLTTWLVALLILTAAAQTPAPKPRTKIVLLGTMHFTPSTTDMYKNAAVDLTSAQRQPQVRAVVEKLAAFHPDQICIEWSMLRQGKLDSVFQAYQQGRYTLKSNEIDQLGLPTAQQLRLPHLTAVNYRGRFDADKAIEFAKQHHQGDLLTNLDTYSNRFMAEANEKMAKLPLKDFLTYVNSPEALNTNAGFYSEYMARIGEGPDYPGIDLLTDWYSTNLHIYANILRQIKPTDKAVLVIFGQGHIPILKSLFATNPAFEVIEVAKVLK
ncbi:DUF5694 domain-containing protein [Hymenobacter crusticola]|uniref:Haem-binding uptake Tiki superfamily ChaN domain-containing protein n=1 Tax=Hymenobacter crusticola TaxID=1770526 RepID=A0A243W8X1_9BACT|nr:DUF5694 domain-containing protein [Hymenobacter crusticola]OUJ70864.1 hypothetical protein BXP70_23320 [Hymenobacter crusticola]